MCRLLAVRPFLLAALLVVALAQTVGFANATVVSPAGTPEATASPLGPIDEIGVEGNAYTSPTYGWRLTWDPATWRVESATSVAFNDDLTLVGIGEADEITFRASQRYQGDAGACVRDHIRGYQEEPGGPTVEVMGKPTTTDGRVSAILSVSMEDPTALPEVRVFIECRRLTTDGITLLVVYLAPPTIFDARFPLVTALLAAIQEPAAPGVGNAGVSGDSYRSPTWGWSLTWDPAVWTVEGTSSEDGVDVLQLGTADYTVSFRAAQEHGGSSLACAESWIQSRRNLEGIEGFVVTEGPVGDTDRAWVRLTFTYPAGGRSIEEYAECRSLAPGRAVLSIDFYAYTERFAAGWPLVEDLLAAIVLPVE